MDHRTLAKRGEPSGIATDSRSFRRGDAEHGPFCQERVAREKARSVGLDRVKSENSENTPRQCVEVARCLPSIGIAAARLPAFELDRNATTAAERCIQAFGLCQLRNDKQSVAALIREAEPAVTVRGARQLLNLRSACSTHEETQSNTADYRSKNHVQPCRLTM